MILHDQSSLHWPFYPCCRFSFFSFFLVRTEEIREVSHTVSHLAPGTVVHLARHTRSSTPEEGAQASLGKHVVEVRPCPAACKFSRFPTSRHAPYLLCKLRRPSHWPTFAFSISSCTGFTALLGIYYTFCRNSSSSMHSAPVSYGWSRKKQSRIRQQQLNLRCGRIKFH